MHEEQEYKHVIENKKVKYNQSFQITSKILPVFCMHLLCLFKLCCHHVKFMYVLQYKITCSTHCEVKQLACILPTFWMQTNVTLELSCAVEPHATSGHAITMRNGSSALLYLASSLTTMVRNTGWLVDRN